MIGNIVYFDDFRRAGRSAVPAAQDGNLATNRRQVLRVQVARIGRLLNELEELVSIPDRFGVGSVLQSRPTMSRAGRGPWPQDLIREAVVVDDPQPDIHSEMLMRMYQAISSEV